MIPEDSSLISRSITIFLFNYMNTYVMLLGAEFGHLDLLHQ